VARQTRAQRRARRSEMTAGEAALSGGPPSPPRRPTARAQPQPSREPRRERSLPGSGTRRFISESWGELKKVEWPGQNQLIQGVAVVLLACLIVGAFLYTCDLIFKRVIQQVFT
jgi:preprotein translocase subunit SecE